MRRTRSGLDPVRGLRRPRRAAVWRTCLVAVLLLAAVTVWVGSSGSSPPATAQPTAHPGTSPAPGPHAPAAPSPHTRPPVAPPPAPQSGSRLPVPDGLVGVPVPLATPAATAMLLPGDRVDLLSTAGDGVPLLVAGNATVLAVDHPGVLLLGLTTTQAHEVVALGAGAGFAVIIRP
jgi:hypothetical protein